MRIEEEKCTGCGDQIKRASAAIVDPFGTFHIRCLRAFERGYCAAFPAVIETERVIRYSPRFKREAEALGITIPSTWIELPRS